MTVFVLKVRENPIDGWGRDLGIRETALGTYTTREGAEAAKAERLRSAELRYCDVGEPWVVEETVHGR